MTPLRSVFRVIGPAAMVVSAFTVNAQQKGQPPAPTPTQPSTGTPGGTTTVPGNTPTTPSPFPPTTQPGQQRQPTIGDQRTQFPEMNRPIYLSGRVMMDDGSAPPDNVVIERICNGVNRPEGYTDTKGRFQFELGRNTALMADASVGSAADPGMPGMGGTGGGRGSTLGNPNGRGFSERDLMGCDIRAVLPGYRSDSISLAGRRFMDNPDVGVIILHRLGNVEGFTWSATTALAPKEAKKAYDKARELMKKNKLPEAQKELEKAVSVYPKFAVAWFDLGMIEEKQKDVAGAQKSYEEALKADAKYTKPYMQLATIYGRQNKWQEVADASGRVIKLNPFETRAYFYNAVANLNLQRYDEAEKSARETIKLDTRHEIPKANHLLGLALYFKQDLSGAVESIREYLKYAPNAPDAETARKQLAELEQAQSAKTGATQPAQQ